MPRYATGPSVSGFSDRPVAQYGRVFAVCSFLLSSILSLASFSRAEALQQEQQEAFRLRIANTAKGAIELSVDKGMTWMLIARVARPASVAGLGAQSSVTEVQRSSPHGLAFGVGASRLIRLLPDAPDARKDKSAILANVPMTSALFKDFLPGIGSPVELLSISLKGGVPFPASFTPKETDILQITARRSNLAPDKIADYAKDAARNYSERAIAKLRAGGGSPANGILTITAKLSPGDNPDAVTFLLDGTTAAIMNRPPYTMKWDTKEWANGEHLIEIRALGVSGSILTKSKALVVVDNPTVK